MTQQEIIEANRLLAEFLGAAENPHGEYEMYGVIPTIDDSESDKHFYNPMEMEFSSSWDWIRPVVDRIAHACEPTTECPINRKRVELFKTVSIFSDISEVYKCCVDFIKWYNENKAI